MSGLCNRISRIALPACGAKVMGMCMGVAMIFAVQILHSIAIIQYFALIVMEAEK